VALRGSDVVAKLRQPAGFRHISQVWIPEIRLMSDPCFKAILPELC
jgi:hypothetical protein